MCGRYSLTSNKDVLTKRYGINAPSSFKPRYNAAPMQLMPVITSQKPDTIQMFKWGLVPSWSLDEKTGSNFINGRAETMNSKTPFKNCVKTQRCLIPADGFYEWKKIGKDKVPFRFTLNTEEIFSFAGLWDTWENPDTKETLNTFTILTIEANKKVEEVSDRMPVILRKDLERLWIAESINDSQINSLIKPYDATLMTSYQTHKAVNSAATDTIECIQPAPKIYPGETFSLFN